MEGGLGGVEGFEEKDGDGGVASSGRARPLAAVARRWVESESTPATGLVVVA